MFTFQRTVVKHIRERAAYYFDNPPPAKTIFRVSSKFLFVIGSILLVSKFNNKYYSHTKASLEGRKLLQDQGIVVEEEEW